MDAVLEIVAPKRHATEIYFPESDGKHIAETDIHAKTMIDLWSALENHFRRDSNIYVTRNLMFYYDADDAKKCFAPDVMFVRGVPKNERRIYKLWEEQVVPQVIFEISSRSTWGEDLQKKWTLYARLGVKEYYIFDPEYDYLDEPLKAYRLQGNEFVEVAIKNGRIFSDELGLEIIDTGDSLRLFDLESREFLLTTGEEHDARLREHRLMLRERKEKLKEREEKLLEREKRQQLEAELEKMREELAKLKENQ